MGKLRRGIDDPGNDVQVHVSGLAGDVLGDHHAFVHALVRQHRPAHHIAHGIHVGKIRATVFVHVHETPLVEQQPGFRGEQAVGVGPPADGDDETLHAFLVFAVLVLIAHRDRALFRAAVEHARAETDVEPLGGELLERLARDLLIGHG